MPQVGGYTSVELDYPTTQPTRAHRPPARYIYIYIYIYYIYMMTTFDSLLMSCEDTRTKKGSSITVVITNRHMHAYTCVISLRKSCDCKVCVLAA